MEKKSSRTGENGEAFKPRDGKVIEHRKLGVWDLYIERDKLLSYLPASLKIDVYVGMWNDIPYLWRTIRDICIISWPLLSLYLILTVAQSLLPSLSLWFVAFLPFNDSKTLITISGTRDSSLAS
jgi:hypothetical protein